jgi:hypothetical protein
MPWSRCCSRTAGHQRDAGRGRGRGPRPGAVRPARGPAALEASPVCDAAGSAGAARAIVFFSNFDTDSSGLTGSWTGVGRPTRGRRGCDSSNFPLGHRDVGTVLNDATTTSEQRGLRELPTPNGRQHHLVVDLMITPTPPCPSTSGMTSSAIGLGRSTPAHPGDQHCEQPPSRPGCEDGRPDALCRRSGHHQFHMMASTVINHAGWYIDDLVIDGDDPGRAAVALGRVAPIRDRTPGAVRTTRPPQ